MSTKCSIVGEHDKYHVYFDVYDLPGRERIYLEFDDAYFEASPNRVTVGVPIDVMIRVWSGMREKMERMIAEREPKGGAK